MITGNYILNTMVGQKWDNFYFDHWEEIQDIDKQSGIYAFYLCGQVVYVGKSVNLLGRLSDHGRKFLHAEDLPETDTNKKYKILKEFMDDLTWAPLAFCTKEELAEREKYYINLYKPIFNVDVPYGIKQTFNGDALDVEDFVNGWITMDDLRALNKVKKGSMRYWAGRYWYE